MKTNEKHTGMQKEAQESRAPDSTNIEEVRKALIMSEILNKKY